LIFETHGIERTWLFLGDRIVSINGQPVTTMENFRAGILAALQNDDHHGYCVANRTIHELATMKAAPAAADNNGDCCPATAGGEHLCFSAIASQIVSSSYCLPARGLVSSSNGTCRSSESCYQDGHSCLVPTFGGPSAANNSMKLVHLGRRRLGGVAGTVQKDFLFVGNPAVIYTTISQSDYCPRYGWLPGWLPDCLLKLARYVASFSGALAVLNVVPCYMLDGQHMMEVLMELGLKGTCALRRRRLQTTITLLGKERLSNTFKFVIFNFMCGVIVPGCMQSSYPTRN
jgi:S2P endopeptidase